LSMCDKPQKALCIACVPRIVESALIKHHVCEA
jgi:hypothetical protein